MVTSEKVKSGTLLNNYSHNLSTSYSIFWPVALEYHSFQSKKKKSTIKKHISRCKVQVTFLGDIYFTKTETEWSSEFPPIYPLLNHGCILKYCILRVCTAFLRLFGNSEHCPSVLRIVLKKECQSPAHQAAHGKETVQARAANCFIT